MLELDVNKFSPDTFGQNNKISPETPRYLLLKGNICQAKKSLCFLRKLSPDHIQTNIELEEIQTKLYEDLEQIHVS